MIPYITKNDALRALKEGAYLVWSSGGSCYLIEYPDKSKARLRYVTGSNLQDLCEHSHEKGNSYSYYKLKGGN